MPRPDEGTIHAWLDGELDAVEAERVAKLVSEDREWGAAAAEARGLIAASARIVSALDVVPSGVLPAGTRAAPPAKSRFTVRPWMRMAAGLVLVAGTATAVWTRTANTPAPGEMATASEDVTPAPAAMPTASAATTNAKPNATTNTIATVASAAADEARTPTRDESRDLGAASGARQAVGALARSDAPVAAKTSANAATAGAVALAERVEAEQTSLDRAMRAPAAAPAAAPAPVATLRLRREARVAEGADAATTLTGCWRVQVDGRADTVLLDPQVARQSGDTLTLIVSADGRLATVRREGSDVARGRSTTSGVGAAASATPSTVALLATRVACPRAP